VKYMLQPWKINDVIAISLTPLILSCREAIQQVRLSSAGKRRKSAATRFRWLHGVSLKTSDWWRMNSGKQKNTNVTWCNPFGNGLYHLLMVIWGMVYYCLPTEFLYESHDIPCCVFGFPLQAEPWVAIHWVLQLLSERTVIFDEPAVFRMDIARYLFFQHVGRYSNKST
jgi:hypothetical protein